MSVKTNLEDIVKIGTDNNAELLSDFYKNVNTKLLWKCKRCNSEFSKTLATIKNNGFKCPPPSVNQERPGIKVKGVSLKKLKKK